jgi:Ankyrin repeats (many copies)
MPCTPRTAAATLPSTTPSGRATWTLSGSWCAGTSIRSARRARWAGFPCTWPRTFRSSKGVRFLFNCWPDVVHQLDDVGRNALHMAVSDPIRLGGETLKKVEFLLTLAPGMVGAADHERRLPLHGAVDHESMLTYTEKTDELVSVVRLLIKRHPGALQQPDSNGNLPLHVAASRYAPMPILRLLIEHHPEALQVRNRQGLLPVHLALHRARSVALEAQFGFCSFPSGCDLTLEVDSVLLLVEQWPGSIQELDPLGRKSRDIASPWPCCTSGPGPPSFAVQGCAAGPAVLDSAAAAAAAFCARTTRNDDGGSTRRGLDALRTSPSQ